MYEMIEIDSMHGPVQVQARQGPSADRRKKIQALIPN